MTLEFGGIGDFGRSGKQASLYAFNMTKENEKKKELCVRGCRYEIESWIRFIPNVMSPWERRLRERLEDDFHIISQFDPRLSFFFCKNKSKSFAKKRRWQ